MPSDSIQCPQCMTRFRFRAEQLQLAGGLVRCGVCMGIFNGIDGEPVQPDLVMHPESEIDSDTIEATDTTEPTKKNPETAMIDIDAEDESSQDLLAGLSTLNHDFDYHHQRHRPIRWHWLLLNFAALLLLAGQLALWQKPALFASRLGPYIQKLCPYHPLLCETPVAAAIPKRDIISTHLLIRKHPVAAKALVVDAIILNRDDELSPFPSLALRFSDINDKTLASRVFQPSEYLAGELNALSAMASQQPIHIALEIVDPGPAAVNYQLQLLP